MKRIWVGWSLVVTMILENHSMGSGGITVDRPANDTLVATETIKFRGKLTSTTGVDAPVVEVRVEGQPPVTATVVGRKWHTPEFDLGVGTREVTIMSGRETKKMVITRAPPGLLTPEPPQTFCFVWDRSPRGVDDTIRQLALISMASGPTDLDGFVASVKKETEQVFTQAFAGLHGYGRAIVNRGGANIHTIVFRPERTTVYGQLGIDDLPDCGDCNQTQESTVWVGTFLDRWADYFGRRVIPKNDWSPLNRRDPEPVRRSDLAQMLGRTAAHEAGHALGLVGSEANCGWMKGLTNHNNQHLVDKFPNTRRFRDGWYIMDPGELSANQALLGLSGAVRAKSPRRTSAIFNEFNHAYLSIIHP